MSACRGLSVLVETVKMAYRGRENDLDAVRVLLEAARGLIKAV
jgi:hypothetical protein